MSTAEGSHNSPRRRHCLTVVITVAVLVRLAFLAWTLTGPRVQPDNPMAAAYLQRGYALSAGWGYVRADGSRSQAAVQAEARLQELCDRVNSGGFVASPASAGPAPQTGLRPDLLHPPGLSLLSSGLHRLSGSPADLLVQAVGIGLDVVTAILVFWLSSSRFGPRVGLYCGLLYAIWPPVAYASVSKMPDGMLAPFVLGALVLLISALHRTGAPRFYVTVLAGAVLGVGCYLRPDYAAMPLFMAPVLFCVSRRLASSLLISLTMQLAVVLVLLPWAVRNHAVSGRWILTSTSVGPTLITGLGEFTNPWGFGRSDEDRAKEAAAAGLESPWSPEADLHFRRVFWRSVSEKPLACLGAIARRVPLAIAPPLSWGYKNPAKMSSFTGMREAGLDQYAAVRRDWAAIAAAYWDVIASAFFGLLFSLSAVVLFFRPEVRKAELLLLLSPHLYAIATHLLTHLEPRFLLPSIGCWMIPIGCICAGLIRRDSEKLYEPDTSDDCWRTTR